MSFDIKIPPDIFDRNDSFFQPMSRFRLEGEHEVPDLYMGWEKEYNEKSEYQEVFTKKPGLMTRKRN